MTRSENFEVKMAFCRDLLVKLASHPHTTYTNHLLYYVDEWFVGFKHSGLLRLSDSGLEAAKIARLESYIFEEDTNQSKLTTMLLSRISCPYYVHKLKRGNISIELFDINVALIVQLHGSLEDFIKTELKK